MLAAARCCVQPFLLPELLAPGVEQAPAGINEEKFGKGKGKGDSCLATKFGVCVFGPCQAERCKLYLTVLFC